MRHWFGIALLFVVAGCSREEAQVVSRLHVERESWDKLRVDLGFVEQGGDGTEQVVVPDSVRVHVFDAEYDTLYTGTAGALSINDAELGDRERILVEACGHFGAESICDQQALTGSPKRIMAEERISFPDDSDFERGSYRFTFTTLRQRFEAGGWESIGGNRPIEGYLLARVAGAPETTVHVPFSATEGHFDLSRHEAFREFQYQIQAALYEGREAPVEFEVYAAAGREPVRVATVEQWVHEMSEEDHEDKLALFIRQSAPQILDRVEAEAGAYVYVDEWSFDDIHDRYKAEIEIRWDGSRFERLRLRGTLEVTEDGRIVTFRKTGGNRHADVLWARRIQDDELHLSDLLVGLDAEEWYLADATTDDDRDDW